jgi:hypothetical protein
MSSEVPRVRPYLSQAFDAFAPFGITFQLQPGRLFDGDPELSQGWDSLHAELAAWSNETTPPSLAHLVVTQWPPGQVVQINGCLIDQMRGISAIYTFASIYGENNDLNAHSDLLIQVLIHELGHMLNLAHGDAQATYNSAMLPTSERTDESTSDAWQQALLDEQANHEQPVAAPIPLLYYPFNLTCRNWLREVAFDPTNLPWHSLFRGNFSDPVQIQDRSLEVAAKLHGSNDQLTRHDGIYFTLAISNNGNQPIRIPALIGPEFGTLRVVVRSPRQSAYLHRASLLKCSGASEGLLPGQIIYRSFALTSNPASPMFAGNGDHDIDISFLRDHGPHAACYGRARLTVPVRQDEAAEVSLLALSKLIHQPSASAIPRGTKSLLEQLPRSSACFFHGQLVMALRTQRRDRRSELLTVCLEQSAPTAIRNAAAYRLAAERIWRGEHYRDILLEYRKSYVAVEHEEMLTAIRMSGKVWEERKI